MVECVGWMLEEGGEEERRRGGRAAGISTIWVRRGVHLLVECRYQAEA